MGTHSARRSGSMTTVAGRGLFTATAAFALIGGSTGMAFAGEAPSSHGHGSSHGESAEHGQGEDRGCEIPVVDQGSEAVDATVNQATGNATAPALEAGNAAVAPVHDVVCPPVSDILGPLAGAADEAAPDQSGSSDEEATSEESEDTADTADTAEAAPSADTATAPAQPTVTDLPVEAPTAS